MRRILYMRALILNSGKGTRMGDLTSKHPKCMTLLEGKETILSRQLEIGYENGIKDFVITTGYFDDVLVEYVDSLKLPVNVEFVRNPLYASTNYIYSIYCAKEHFGENSVILLHGDLVFENSVFHDVATSKSSCGVVSSKRPLPEKDFKASVEGGRITKIGTYVFENALAFQPLYKLTRTNWDRWFREIEEYVENNNVNCYAEEALNDVLHQMHLLPFDVLDRLCEEIDNAEDLAVVRNKLERIK